MDIGTHFFIERVVKHWNSLPGELVDAPSLPVFERCLDNTLDNFFSLLVSLEVVMELD